MADAVTGKARSAYELRFAFAYALVALVFGGVIVLFAFLVSKQETPPWSAYQPKGKGIDRAQAIANHISPRYREGGQLMAAVDAQRPVINSANVDAFAFARSPTSRIGGG